MLSSLNSNAEAIYAAQNKQGDTQARLFDEMQTELYVARGLIADVAATAGSLQLSVEKTASKIATMATLGGVTTSILRWGWLSLVVFVLYQFSPRYAAFAMAAASLFLLLWASDLPSSFASIPSDTVLIHYASGYKVPLIPTLNIAAFLIVIITIGTVYRLSANFRAYLDRTFSMASRLPFHRYTKDSESYL